MGKFSITNLTGMGDQQGKGSFYDQYFAGTLDENVLKHYQDPADSGTTPASSSPAGTISAPKNKRKAPHRDATTNKGAPLQRKGKQPESSVRNAGAISKAQSHYIKTQLQIQEREKQRRDILKEKTKAKKQRKRSTQALRKRTNKGQPVMHLQIHQMLQKIEKDVNPQ